MLKKLLKQEFKATGRIFLPAIAIFAALLIVERVGLLASDILANAGDVISSIVGIFVGLVSALTVVALIAMFFVPVVYAAIRFYKNLLGDEGYLMHTLPVAEGSLILSKFLTALCWFLVGTIAVVLFGGLFLFSLNPAEFTEILGEVSEVLTIAVENIGGTLYLIIVLMFLAALAQVGYTILLLFSSMSIGQTSNNHRVLLSAAAYLGIQFVTEFVVMLLIAVIAMGSEGWIQDFILNMENNPMVILNYISAILGIGFVFYCALGTAHFFLSRHMLTKKLNLQ